MNFRVLNTQFLGPSLPVKAYTKAAFVVPERIVQFPKFQCLENHGGNGDLLPNDALHHLSTDIQ